MKTNKTPMFSATSITTPLLFCCASLLIGCQVSPEPLGQKTPLDAVVKLPLKITSFGGWLTTSLMHNPSYQQAKERLLQASLTADDRLAARFPDLRLSLERSRKGSSSITNINSLTMAFSWELDWLGKLSNNEQQALYLLEQARQNEFAAKQSVLKQVSLAYISANQAVTLLDVYKTRANVLSQQLAMLEENYQLGLTSALDVYSARSNLASEQSRVVTQELAVKQSLNQLYVLAGLQPQAPDGDLVQPVLSTNPVSDLSSSLLLARPDVSAAWFELLAANQTAAVAFKSQFPTFKLSSSAGHSADEFKSLLKGDLLWSWVLGLSQPLFDGGRLANAYEREQSNERIALSKLQDVLNKAYGEISLELTRFTAFNERVALAQTAFENAQNAQSLSFSQYQKGLVSFTTVLDAQKRSLDAEVTLINLKNEQLSQIIELETALGRPLTQLFALKLENQNEF